MNNELEYKVIKPDNSLTELVESFWCLQNPTDNDREIVILPDGRIDLIFTQSQSQSFQATLLGIGTQPDQTILPSKTTIFAISFKLLSAEYVLGKSIANILDRAEYLHEKFLDFTENDLNSFDYFNQKASQKIQSVLPQEIDSRKQKLFDLIYTSNGEMAVGELAEKVFWSSRQINRYFNQQFGLSLKAYCNILRFRSSFGHIKKGNLFPQQDFADQSHFIKEVKRLSGVLPKELNRNKNDRFIQFSTLTSK